MPHKHARVSFRVNIETTKDVLTGADKLYYYSIKAVKGRAIYVEPIKEPVRDTASLPEDNHEAAAPPDSAKEEVEASP